MNDHFLLELVWVIFTYGWKPLVIGLTLSLFLVLWGSKRVHLLSRLTVLAVATLGLWIAIVVGTELGYHTWQCLPDPPDEAFSDTGGPLVSLFLGWLPSLVLLGLAHGLFRLARGRPNPPSPPGAAEAA